MTTTPFQTGFAVMCAFLIGGMFMYAINNAVSLPDVHFSYSTGECVEVINYAEGHKYTCDNQPTKFYHVWVE